MSTENPHRETRKDNHHPYEIKLDTPFKPFETARKFYYPQKGKQPFLIPEKYTHTLLLRRGVLLYGIRGYVDIISENPDAPAEILVRNILLEKPLGDADFKEIYRGRNNITYVKQPYILRLGFPLGTPNEDAKLLNSYVDVTLGKEQYVLAWNTNISRVRRAIRRLENGEEIIVVEKNLFNLKNTDTEKDIEGEDNDHHRLTFVWLPDDLKKLRAISLTFHQLYDKGDQKQPTEPIIPERVVA